MLILRQRDYDKIIAHARACFPEEACGLLAGIVRDDGMEVQQVYLLENADHRTDHFRMKPTEQLAAAKDMHAKGMTLLGNWHSHPNSPAYPSGEDQRLAYDPKLCYLILSLSDQQKPLLGAFYIEREGTAIQIEIKMLSEHLQRSNQCDEERKYETASDT